MKLADLRRFSIRKQFQIRFRLRNGLECVITDRGIAEVPALKGPPDFNLEEELAAAGEFLLESAAAPDKQNPVKPRPVTPRRTGANGVRLPRRRCRPGSRRRVASDPEGVPGMSTLGLVRNGPHVTLVNSVQYNRRSYTVLLTRKGFGGCDGKTSAKYSRQLFKQRSQG